MQAVPLLSVAEWFLESYEGLNTLGDIKGWPQKETPGKKSEFCFLLTGMELDIRMNPLFHFCWNDNEMDSVCKHV